jgi:hypothetical protein
MKKHFTILSLAILLISSCNRPSDDNPSGENSRFITYNNGIRFDTSIYFSVTFRGKTLTVHGFQPVGLNEPQYCSSKISQSNNGQGKIIHDMTLNNLGEATKIYLGTSFYEYNSKHVNCSVVLTWKREGSSADPLGIYNVLLGGTIDDLMYPIKKTYTVDRGASAIINITKIDAVAISGTISCNLIDIDGVTSIPATGSFRLPNKSL